VRRPAGGPRDARSSQEKRANPSRRRGDLDTPEDRQDEPIAEAFARERKRLWRFIRARVGEHMDAEDILQDVFYELVVAYRLMKPIEHLGAWLFRVARNRITDRFRKRSRESSYEEHPAFSDSDEPTWTELLPSHDAGPEAAYARSVLLAALEDALAELPRSQREVFIAHELEGRTFKELERETGVGINTLLSRKRYAVLHLRRRLQSIYDDFIEKGTLE
jgi:RNA polymerase sigma factor (sigma-70 family)